MSDALQGNAAHRGSVLPHSDASISCQQATAPLALERVSRPPRTGVRRPQTEQPALFAARVRSASRGRPLHTVPGDARETASYRGAGAFLGRKLAIPPEEIAVHLAAEHVPDDVTAGPQSMLRHWTAEAMAVARDRIHYDILRLCRNDEFRADCRWVADEAGVAVDDVNVALARLLRLGLIEIGQDGVWRDRTALARLTEPEFRRLALARVREKAAEDRVNLGKETTKRG